MDSLFRQALMSSLLICLGFYIIMFGFLKRINQWFYVDRLGKKKHSLPPGDMGWPLFGNLLPFLKAFRSENREAFINDMVDRHGRTGIYKSYLFGSPSIIVCNPEGCKKILTDERFIPYLSQSYKKLFDNKLQTPSASEHRHLRKLLSYPINGNEALTLYMGSIADIVKASLEEWSSMNKPIEFMKEMETITFKAFIHVFMGSMDKPSCESMEKYNNDYINGIFYSLIGIPGFPIRKALKAKKMLEKIFVKVLDDRRRSRMNRTSDHTNVNNGMIDLLMKIEDENGEKFSNKDISALLLVFLVAGHHSIAKTAAWTAIYLHSHPEILQKARKEQMEILKRRPSTQKGLNLEEINQMEYLAKVIDETLRLVTPFTLVREALEDVYINGYFIPKGWKVLIWLNAVHMDPQTYTNPKQFIPSRWDNQKPKPGSFLPFGAGSRFCLGATFAKFQMSIFLHYFLLNYKLEQINPGGPISYLPATPKPVDNCLAKVIKLP